MALVQNFSDLVKIVDSMGAIDGTTLMGFLRRDMQRQEGQARLSRLFNSAPDVVKDRYRREATEHTLPWRMGRLLYLCEVYLLTGENRFELALREGWADEILPCPSELKPEV